MSSLAIIALPVEQSSLSDYVATRETPAHVAALIMLIALFIIAWVSLSEATQSRSAPWAKGTRPFSRP